MTRAVGIIFRKEFLDILRDRKTLLFMIAVPMLVMPGLMSAIARIAKRGRDEAQSTTLIVQCEPDERDRFLGLVQRSAHLHDAEIDRQIQAFSAETNAELAAIGRDLALPPRDVLLGLNLNPKVRAHPRAAAAREKIAAAYQELQKGGKAGLTDEARREAQRVFDLVPPLASLEYRSAAEVAALPRGERAPSPDSDLPDAVRGDAVRRAAADAITSRRIHARLRVPNRLDEKLADRDDQLEVEVEWDSTWPLSDEAHRRLVAAIDAAGEIVRDDRLAKASLPTTFIQPLVIAAQNVAPPEKEALNLVGGILPYILILMCFLGGNFPAIDLGAGEKERLTLETLLVTPVRRGEIATAKFLVVFLCALTAAVVATVSLAYTFQSGLMSPELAKGLKLDLRPATAAIALALVVPLAAVFASILLSLSIYAKSFKEASSYMAPVQFLIIIPAALSMIPTMQLDRVTAWIPVVNVSLGLREVLTLGGKAPPWTELAIIVGSSLLLAVLALKFCAHRFTREDVLFRS